MSQSATLYCISETNFKQLENAGNKRRFDIASAKNHATFQGTFMGLEFVLSKGRDSSTVALVEEIFNPKQSLGEGELENLTPEEQFEYYEKGVLIPYLKMETITKLNEFLYNISEADISLNFDAKELNDNGIYPEVWQDGISPNQAYNKRDLVENLIELKQIVREAKENNYYILVFVG